MLDTTSVPDPKTYFLAIPLYERFDFRVAYDRSEYSPVLRIEFFHGTLDTFCRACERDSVFKSVAELPHVSNGVVTMPPRDTEDLLAHPGAFLPLRVGASPSLTPWDKYACRERTITHQFACTRDSSHLMLFISRIRRGSTEDTFLLTKIGQDPSLADLQLSDYRRYRKILGGAGYREMSRAIGLSSHGVGIGSFVYLRRVFESLIEHAHETAKKDSSWNEEEYTRSRMDEKINLLKHFLPVSSSKIGDYMVF